MSKKRDLIAEILDRRTRHPKRTVRWSQLMNRVEPLLLSLHHVLTKAPTKHSCRTELLRYFPIAIIAASEGYFRLVYRDLIDFGNPYLQNAAAFKDLRLGHEAICAIHGRQTTVGQFIAHQLSHNRLGDILANMDALTGDNFKVAVQQRLDAQASRSTEPTMESMVFKFVARTFDLRHIFCHELAPLLAPNATEIDHCFRAMVAFLYCSESHVQTLLQRNA
jgi:hypothetical protein